LSTDPRPSRRCSSLAVAVLAAAAIASGGIGHAEDYVGKAFRVTGRAEGSGLRVERIQWREADDGDRGQVVGVASSIDAGSRTLQVGPVRVAWTDETRWDDIDLATVRGERVVKITGRSDGAGHLVAKVIEPASTRGWRAGDVQITGTVSESTLLPDGRRLLDIFGVAAELRRPGYNRAESLTRRQDARRPEKPMEVEFLGRPLRITGEYDATWRDRRNHGLDDRRNPNIRDDLAQEFQLELFWRYSENTYVFVEGKARYEDEFRRTRGTGDSVASLERGLMWLFMDGFAGNRVGLQVGRQNVRELREWWWDADLDAARAYFDEGPWHAEAGVAKDVARVSSLDRGIDPERKGMYRGFATLSWMWASRETLELFALRQQDASEAAAAGRIVESADRDPSDANLTWFGVRALGQRALGDLGTMRYWADAAWVRGTDTVTTFASNGAARAPSVRQVRGHAFDAGVSWQTPWPGKVALTAGFATGSGDGDVSDGTDGNFRQTGLHKNKGRFFGVNRFRYYGELTRPELANLNVSTFAIGVPFLEASSAELVYHRYWQSRAATTLRDIRIDAPLDGQHREVGEEWDLVLGFRDLRQVDFFLTAGHFRAGAAYGAFAGKTARLLTAEMVLFF